MIYSHYSEPGLRTGTSAPLENTAITAEAGITLHTKGRSGEFLFNLPSHRWCGLTSAATGLSGGFILAAASQRRLRGLWVGFGFMLGASQEVADFVHLFFELQQARFIARRSQSAGDGPACCHFIAKVLRVDGVLS